MSNAFIAPHFQSPENAREWLEGQRWPEGPVCSHCGTINHAYKTKKPGWYRCAEKECRKDFTVTTGTLMERSHIALNKWLMAFYLVCSSKKGVSAHQLHRALGLDYKSAWFLHHRIREAMREDGKFGPLGGPDGSGIVEADETYYGPTAEAKPLKIPRTTPYTKKGRSGPANKRAILSLVERGGRVRSFHIPNADKVTVDKIVKENIAKEAHLHTDESRLYGDAGDHFAAHETVTDATESLVTLLKNIIVDIRVIVADSAKSNGTLLGLAAKAIVMGASSELGPIEPLEHFPNWRNRKGIPLLGKS
jgi:transposase-like protein